MDTTSQQPVHALDGIRVVDFSRGLSGALATMVLADNGAEVVRVEAPGGDPERAQTGFRQWRRGQKSVLLDVHSTADRAKAADLAATADVVIENWRPGVAEELGLDYATLSARNPGLVFCSITGFGTKGKFAHVKGYEAVVEAKAGRFAQRAHRLGLKGRTGQLFYASPHSSYGAAQTALHGILAAIHVREKCGRGQKVETSMIQALMPFDVWDWIFDFMLDKNPASQAKSSHAVSASGVPLSPYFFTLAVARTKDGRWLQFANVMPHMWYAFLKATELEYTLSDPEFAASPNFDSEDASLRFWNLLLDRIAEKTMDEWMAAFMPDPNIAVDVFRDTQDAKNHPQMRINGHVVAFDDPEVGPMEQIGPLVKLWGTPARPPSPAPRPGEHNALLESLPAPRVATPTGPAPTHALDGVTVLELGTFYAAPFGPTLLAELGARVIKIEPLTGDPLRFGLPIPETGGAKALQGKESVAADLNTPEGREIVYEIARRADLVMCSFRQGVAERQGVDYDTLRRINPNLVYHHGVAYGIEGDFPKRPLYGPTPPAVSGEVFFQMGEGNLPAEDAVLDRNTVQDLAIRLRTMNPGMGDPIAALAVTTGMLLGLVARDRTGIAQQSMTTMIQSACYVMSGDFIWYEGKPQRKLPDADLHGMGPLYRMYETPEGMVFLAAAEGREWDNLCNALAAADPAAAALATDPRFTTHDAREANANALGEALGAIFATRPAQEWEDLLLPADVACVRVNDKTLSRFGLHDPLMWENGFTVETEHFALGKHPRHGLSVNLSLTPGKLGQAPWIGQHTRAVLRELGHSDGEIAALDAKGIIKTAEAAPVVAAG